MVVGGKVLPTAEIQPDPLLIHIFQPVGGFPQDPQQAGKTHGTLFGALADLAFNTLGDTDVILFDVVDIAGDLQGQLLGLGRHLHAGKILVQPVGIAHDPLDLLGTAVHEIDLGLEAGLHHK